jgi:hypothetical protein
MSFYTMVALYLPDIHATMALPPNSKILQQSPLSNPPSRLDQISIGIVYRSKEVISTCPHRKFSVSIHQFSFMHLMAEGIHIHQTSQDTLAKDDDEDRVNRRDNDEERLHVDKETENQELDERGKVDVMDTDECSY